MKKYFKIAEALSHWAGFAKRTSVSRATHRGGKTLEARKLNLEQLEERQLLAVTAAEYDAIREMYTGLNLSESSENLNLIEINANDLTSESLWQAIDAAQKTQKDDLVVIRTSDLYNTMALGDGTMEINLDSAHYGSLSIVGYGSQMLQITGVEAPLLTISGGTVNIGGLTFLGLTTDGTISTSDLVNVSDSAKLTTSRVLYMTQFGENLDEITPSNILKTGSYSLAEDMINPAICTVEFQVEGSTWAYMTGINAQDSSDYQEAIYGAQYPNMVVWHDANKSWDTDYNLCWAASASDMLYYTNWANQTINPSFTHEQEVFEYFKDHFTDAAGNSYYGNEWFLTGNYEMQRVPGWSQLTNTGGGFYTNIVPSIVTNIGDYINYYSSETQGDQMMVLMETALRGYRGVGLSIAIPEVSIGHAITCWGYLYDTEIDSSTPEYYTGLILTDSDDNQYTVFNADMAWNADENYYQLTGYHDGAYYLNAFSALDRYVKQDIDTPEVESAVVLDAETIQIEIAPVEGATGYTVQWAVSSDFDEPSSEIVDSAGSFTITGLRSNTEYFIRVQANENDVYLASEWSEVISATTMVSVLPSVEDALFVVNDSNDENNQFYYSGVSGSWCCGTDENEVGIASDSFTVLQTETGEAQIEFIAQNDWVGNFNYKVTGENADGYWDINGNIATWNDNGFASPKREFTFVTWNDKDNDDIVDSGEDNYTFNVSIQWANISICVDQPFPGSDEVYFFETDAQGNIVAYSAGHGFWDNRATNALLGSGIVNADLLRYANTSEGYGATEWGIEAINDLVETGNFICDGRTQLSPNGDTSLARWSNVDAYKTFTIESLSDYLALLEYNKDIYENPPTYVQVETAEIGEMQCMVGALNALRAAGFTVESYPQDGSPTGLYDFEYEWTNVPATLPGTTDTIIYNGTSPAHVGQDLVRAGGQYTFGKDENAKENEPFNGHNLDDQNYPQPKDNGSYSVGDMRAFLEGLKSRDLSSVTEAERAALEEYVLQLSSYSEGEYVIYLNFEGDDSDSNMLNGFVPRYTIDGDQSREYFTFEELTVMYEAWVSASEDFALFNVNVTLNEEVYKSATQRLQGLIGGTVDDWYGSGALEKPAGGVSGGVAGGSFYVFAQGSRNGTGIGNTVSHEAGHNFRLAHQSQPGIEYYGGNSQWSAIMGSGSSSLTQWSKGEFPNACITAGGTPGNTQDDIERMLASSIELRLDENNVDIYTATYLDMSKVTSRTKEVTLAEGIIGGYWNDADYAETIFEDNEDADYFMFEINDDEAYHFNIGGITGGITNLDARANVYNAAGELLYTYNSDDALNIEFTFGGEAGVYYISVFGTGKDTGTAGVYSDYGSLGMYDIRVKKTTALRVNTNLDTVNADDSFLSLREAVARVNAMSDAEAAYIYFENAGTYYLNSELVLTHSVGFVSEGAGITFYATGTNRVMTIGEDGASEVINVTFDGINIQHGRADFGGGLYINANANVTFDNGTLSGNMATTAGGAVYVDGGSFAIFGGSVSGNSANEAGAGVYVASGNFTVNDALNSEFYDVNATTTFSNNIIYNADFEANVFSFLRYQDSFGNARGGAVHVSTGSSSINAATFSYNHVSGWFSQGAGLYVDNATVEVSNSRFTNNSSLGNSAATYDVSGAGIYVNFESMVTLNDSTVSYNNASSYVVDVISVEDAGGAGVYVDGTLTVNNSVISRNAIVMNSLVGPRAGGNGFGPRIGGAGIGGLNGSVTVNGSDISYNTISINGAIDPGVDELGIGGVGIGMNGGELNITDTEIIYNSISSISGPIGIGGGIGTRGNMTLTDSLVRENSGVANGGGIYALGGDVTISNSSIRENTSAEGGAGLYSNGATLRIADSSYIVHNTVYATGDGFGAGIYVNGGTFDLEHSFVEYNTLTTVGRGAGAGVYATNSTTSISGSYFYGNIMRVSNATSALGGGVYSDTNSFTMLNTEVSGNVIEATGEGAITAEGAGVYMLGGTMQSSTVNQNSLSAITSAAGNQLTVAGGGIYAYGKIISTLVAQNYLYALGAGGATSLPNAGGVGIASVTSGGQLTIQNATVTENMGFSQWDRYLNPYYVSVAGVTSMSPSADLVMHNSVVIRNSMTNFGGDGLVVQRGTQLEYLQWLGVDESVYSQAREIYALLHPNVSDEVLDLYYENWLQNRRIYKDGGVNPYDEFSRWETMLYNGFLLDDAVIPGDYSAAAFEGVLALIQAELDGIEAYIEAERANNPAEGEPGHHTDEYFEGEEARLIRIMVDDWEEVISLDTGSTSHDLSVYGLGSDMRAWIYGHNNYTGQVDPWTVYDNLSDPYFRTSIWRHQNEVRYGMIQPGTDTSRYNGYYRYGVDESPFLLDGKFMCAHDTAFDPDVFHWTIGDYHINNATTTAANIINRGNTNYLDGEGLEQSDAWGGDRLSGSALDIGAFEWQSDDMTENGEDDITINSLLDYVNPNDGIITMREALGVRTMDSTIFDGYAADGATITFDPGLRGGTFTPSYNTTSYMQAPYKYYGGANAAYRGTLYITKSITIDAAAVEDASNETSFGVTFLASGDSTPGFVLNADGPINVNLTSMAVGSFHDKVNAPRTPREYDTNHYSHGGGIVSYLDDNSTITIAHSLFKGLDHASGGTDPLTGVIYHSDGPSYGPAFTHRGDATITITNTTFVDNFIRSFSVGYGGAMSTIGADVTLEGVTFKDNTILAYCEAYGGALFVQDGALTIGSHEWQDAEGTYHYIHSSFVNNTVRADATNDDRNVTSDDPGLEALLEVELDSYMVQWDRDHNEDDYPTPGEYDSAREEAEALQREELLADLEDDVLEYMAEWDSNHKEDDYLVPGEYDSARERAEENLRKGLVGPRLAMEKERHTIFSNGNTVFAYGGAVCVLEVNNSETKVDLTGVTFDNNLATATADYDEKDLTRIFNATAGGGGIYIGNEVGLTVKAQDNENEPGTSSWTAPKTTSFTRNDVRASVVYENEEQAMSDANYGSYRTAKAAGGGIGFAGDYAYLFGVEVANNTVTATSNLGKAESYGGGMQVCSDIAPSLAISNYLYGFNETTREIESAFDNNSIIATGNYGALAYGGGISELAFNDGADPNYDGFGQIWIDNTSLSHNQVSSISSNGYAESLGGGLYNYGFFGIQSERGYNRLEEYDGSGNDVENMSPNGWFKSGRDKFGQQFNVLFNDNTVTADGNQLGDAENSENANNAAVAAGGGVYFADYSEAEGSSYDYLLSNVQADNNSVTASSTNHDINEPGNLNVYGGGVALADPDVNIFEFNDSSASGNTVTAISTQTRDLDNPDDEIVFQITSVNGAGIYAGTALTTVEQSRAARNSGIATAAVYGETLGGGLYNENDVELKIHRGRFLANTLSTTTDAFGGGVYYTGAGDLAITGSSFAASNTVSGANAFGGGVYTNSDGALSIDCTDETPITGELTVIEAQFNRLYLNRVAGDEESTVDVLGKGGGLYKEAGTDLTITDSSRVYGNYASNNGGGVWVRYSGDVVINNKTEFYDNEAGIYGGGMFSRDNGDVTVSDTLFENNLAGRDGGAIHNESGAGITVERSSFNSNSANRYGGAIYNINNESAIIDDSIFTHNNANERGGAIYDNNNKLKVIGSQFMMNEATNENGYGGALCVLGYTTTEIEDSYFAENTAYGGGGAIANYSNDKDGDGLALKMTNTDFVENAALGEVYGNGGAIYNLRSGIQMVGDTANGGNVFVGNTAMLYGGAIYNEQGKIDIQDYSFMDNTAGTDGGAIYNLNLKGNDISLIGTVPGLALSNNTANGEGGAIWNNAGALTIENYEITNNTAGIDGGAIYNYSTKALSITSTHCTSIATEEFIQGVIDTVDEASGFNLFDINGDGVTDLVDATLFTRYLEGRTGIELVDGLGRTAAWTRYRSADIIAYLDANIANFDADGNDEINATDSTLFERYIDGKRGAELTNGFNTTDWGRETEMVVTAIAENISGGNGGVVWTRGDLTIIGSDLIDNTAAGSGGAIYIVTNNQQNLNIRGNQISRNYAGSEVDEVGNRTPSNIGGSGGAIYISAKGSQNTVLNVAHITDNVAQGAGGALWFNTNAALSLDLEDVVELSNNNADADGGAVYAVSKGEQTFTLGSTVGGTDIQENSAGGSGGALYLVANTQNTTITGRTMTGNEANLSGGMIYRTSKTGGELELEGVGVVDPDWSVLASNFAHNGFGGAIYSDTGNITLNNIQLGGEGVGNESFYDGGAIYSIGNGDVEVTADVDFAGNDIQGNAATNGSGGFVYAIGDVTVAGYDFVNNTAGESGGAIYSDIGAVNVESTDALADNNVATNGSGGFVYATGGAVTVTGYDFVNNTAGESGGAIYSDTGAVNVESTDALADNNVATNGSGGFVYATGGAVTVTGYDFVNNTAGESGGAIYSTGGKVMITDKDFDVIPHVLADNNVATTGDGGFAYVTGGDLIIRYYDLTNNSAVIGSGGAIYHDGGLLFLNHKNVADSKDVDPVTKFNVTNNTAGTDGGAIYHTNGKFGTVALNVQDNVAGQSGGAFFFGDTGTDGYTYIFLSDISNNQASVAGGGIYQETGNILQLVNVLVSDNMLTTENSMGAGVYNGASIGKYFSTTIAGNEASRTASQGGGVYIDGGTNTFTNSIVALNEAAEGAQIYNNGGEINASYSVSSMDVDWKTLDPEHSFNYDDQENPLDLFADSTIGNYHLLQDCEVVGQGNVAEKITTYDLDGELRTTTDVSGETISIGVYENFGTTPATKLKKQTIYSVANDFGEAKEKEVRTGGDFTIDVNHRTTTYDKNTYKMTDVTTLSVCIYYDSSLLTFNAADSTYLDTDAVLNKNVFFVQRSDSDINGGGDNDSSTDSYIKVTWNNDELWGEGALDRVFEILGLSFTTARVSAETVTSVNFGYDSVTFDFIAGPAESVVITILPPNFDVDGNEAFDLNDAAMIIRYFNAETAGTLDVLDLSDLIDDDTERDTTDKVKTYIANNRSIFNINGDVAYKTKADIFTEKLDGEILRRYLAGYEDCDLISGLSFPNGSIRRNFNDITRYIERFVVSHEYNQPNEGPYQVVRGETTSSLNGEPIDLTVSHKLYDNDSATELTASTLSLRIHYDSSKLTFDPTQSEFLVTDGRIKPNAVTFIDEEDSNNEDGVVATDRYIWVSWNTTEGNFGSEDDFEDIFKAHFTLVNPNEVTDTELYFTAVDLTANYRFGGWDDKNDEKPDNDEVTDTASVTVKTIVMDFDFDKDGKTNIQSDSNLWMRYNVNPDITDTDLTAGITAGNGADIKEQLDENDANVSKMLDINKDQVINTNDVKLFVLRLGGFTGENLVDGLVDYKNSEYKSLDEAIEGIEAHFEKYKVPLGSVRQMFQLSDFASDLSVEGSLPSVEVVTVQGTNDFTSALTDLFAPEATLQQAAAPVIGYDERMIALMDQAFISDEDDWNDELDLDLFVEETAADAPETAFDADPLAILLTE